MIVAFEGLDASGKATQSRLFAEKIGAPLFSFPRYETMVGKLIRRLLRQESKLVIGDGARDPDEAIVLQTLMVADKMEALSLMPDMVGAPEIRTVVCDRWKDSAVAYGTTDGVSREWLDRTQSLLPTATLTFFLDASPEEGLRRRPNMRDRYEKDREQQDRIRENYLALSAQSSWTTIDGVGTIEQVHERVMAAWRAFWE